MENNQSSPGTNFGDYKIADLSLSDLGRRKIGIAKGEAFSRGKDYGFFAHDGRNRSFDRDFSGIGG